jgi:ABC-type multidrug transport system ATPase subunit
MDEADVLGDRIGIMQNGRLVTVGSSLFLKKRYGVGYNFTFEKQKALPPQPNDDVDEPDLPELFSIDKLDEYLRSELSGEVKLLSNVGDEITYQVPTECSAQFKDFFLEFDQKLPELKIQGYGISVTSLEEVFLRVSQDDQEIPLIKDMQK